MMKSRSLLLSAALIFGGCALDSGAPRVRVAMPTQGAQQLSFGLGGSLLSVADPTAPTSFAGFHCFGLNVTGPGVGKSLICANDPTAGKFGGFAAFSGGVVDVRVPAGPARTVELLGIMSGDGSCPLVAAMTPNDNGPKISAFHLGETTIDLFEDKRVSIQAAYVDDTTAVERFANCGEEGASGSFPDPSELTAPVQGWWDVGWSAAQLSWINGNAHASSWGVRAGTNGNLAGTARTYLANSGNNGRPALVFNTGFAGISGGGGAGLTSPSGLTLVAVASRTIDTAVQTIATISYGSTEFKIGYTNADDLVLNTAGQAATGPNVPILQPSIVVGQWNGANQYLYLNGVQVATSAAPGAGITGVANVAVGKGYIGEDLDGEISEVAMYGQSLTTFERESLECYLGQKYSIPISGHTLVFCP